MQIPQPVIGLKEYHDAIIAALADTSVPVYLDTSVLMWLLRVGQEARNEFLRWCRQELRDRVKIPTWAAHELYRHLRESTVQTEVSKKTAHYRKTLGDLLEDICVTADTTLSAATEYANPEELVRRTRNHIIEINDVIAGIERTRNRYDRAVLDLITFVNERLIDSNIFTLLEPIGATQATRFNGRIPPGFNDARKTQNSIGDLVLWQEILADLQHGSPREQAIIITNDNKSDWYCKPLRVRTYDGKEKGEDHAAGLEAKLAHPLLEHELRSTTGTKVLYIINTRILSVLLDRSTPSTVRAFTAATHPKGTTTIGINWKQMAYQHPAASSTPPAPPPTEEKPEASAQGDLDDLDANTLGKAPSVTADRQHLLDLLVGPIPDRNAAAAKLLGREALAQLSLEELVHLGRRLYQAAVPLAASGMDVLDVLRQEPPEHDNIVNALALGMFIELYFHRDLVLRRTPLDGPFEGLYQLQTQDRFQPSVRKLSDLLLPYRDLYLSIPSLTPVVLDVRISIKHPVGAAENQLTGILCGGHELLCEVDPASTSALSSLLGKLTGTVAEICALISRRFFVPLKQLKPDRGDSAALMCPAHLGICHCRTDLGGIVDDFTVAFEEDQHDNGH